MLHTHTHTHRTRLCEGGGLRQDAEADTGGGLEPRHNTWTVGVNVLTLGLLNLYSTKEDTITEGRRPSARRFIVSRFGLTYRSQQHQPA